MAYLASQRGSSIGCLGIESAAGSALFCRRSFNRARLLAHGAKDNIFQLLEAIFSELPEPDR